MTKKPDFQPTEEQIEKVLKQSDSDPRKLAIAYLKANHRAKIANLEANLGLDVAEMVTNVLCGDFSAATKVAKKATRRMNEFKENQKK